MLPGSPLNPSFITPMPRKKAQKRDRLNISRRPLDRDREWYGAAPPPVPEADRHWRPKDIIF